MARRRLYLRSRAFQYFRLHGRALKPGADLNGRSIQPSVSILSAHGRALKLLVVDNKAGKLRFNTFGSR